MILLPNFRLPILIHTRSANAKWLYEISQKNPIWISPEDASLLGINAGDLSQVDTEIGYFVDAVWVTEGIKPGVFAVSHHLGRFRFQEPLEANRGASNLVELDDDGQGGFLLRVIHSAQAWESSDPMSGSSAWIPPPTGW